MLDHTAGTLALRNRALSVTVASTGSASLSATATGYARAAGSFVTDGFAVGMEITLVTGFGTGANNQAVTAQGRVITEVTALALSCAGTATEAPGAGRLITCGLPFKRAWENLPFEPTTGFPYVDESFVPGTSELITFPFSGGSLEERGLYVLRVYLRAGDDVKGIRKTVDALRALYTPGTTLVAGSDLVLVSGDPPGPQAGQILRLDDPGWVAVVLRIPWEARTANTIAA